MRIYASRWRERIADGSDRAPKGLESVYGGTALHDQSHGESFLALAANRSGGHGLYPLDEPEAAP